MGGKTPGLSSAPLMRSVPLVRSRGFMGPLATTMGIDYHRFPPRGGSPGVWLLPWGRLHPWGQIREYLTEKGLRFRFQMRRSVVQNNRSREFRGGRGRWRFSTATCCRRARISRAISLRERKKTRSALSTAIKTWTMNSWLYYAPCQDRWPVGGLRKPLIPRLDEVLSTHNPSRPLMTTR